MANVDLSRLGTSFFSGGSPPPESAAYGTSWPLQCTTWYKKHLRTLLTSVSSCDATNNHLSRTMHSYWGNLYDQNGARLSLEQCFFFAGDCIADQFCGSENITIHKVCQELRAAHLLPDLEGDKEDAFQLAFTLVGWITMLYNPNTDPRKGFLKLANVMTNTNNIIRRRRQSRKRISNALEPAEAAYLATQPFAYVLSQFSLSIPHPIISAKWDKVSRSVTSDTFYSDALISSNISYYSLKRVGKVRIRWTESICEHLDFDHHSQILTLFSCPSFCGMVCINDTAMDVFKGCVQIPFTAKDSVMRTYRLTRSVNCSFLKQYFSRSHHGLGGATHTEEVFPDDLFCEILCSLQMIFSQDSKSGRDLRDSGLLFPQNLPQDPIDPLLGELKSRDWRSHTENAVSVFFQELEIPFKTVYSAREDFPYLGQKLLALQNYMDTQNPGDLNTLLHDRRDVLRFWTFWVVVNIGGLSVVLAFLQLCLVIVQVAGQFV